MAHKKSSAEIQRLNWQTRMKRLSDDLASKHGESEQQLNLLASKSVHWLACRLHLSDSSKYW